MNQNKLIENIDKLHTTPVGIDRIRKNLKLDLEDVVSYCKSLILSPKCHITKQGKNWYCEFKSTIITVNSHSYTIITAHKKTPIELNVEPFLQDLSPFLDDKGRLITFPAKYKKKLIALWYLAGKIETNRQYTESEINTLLDEWTLFHDPATLRRELCNKCLLNRTQDCRNYQKADNILLFDEFINKYV